MKNFLKSSILIFIFALLSFGHSYSQNTDADAQLGYDETFIYFTGATADTIGVADSIWTFTVRKKADAGLYFYTYMELDSLDGTANIVDIIRQKRVTLNESWTNIDTVTWHVTSTDTSFSKNTSSSQYGEYFRIRVQGRNDLVKAKISKLDFKFFK
jgi:hypothetical protein